MPEIAVRLVRDALALDKSDKVDRANSFTMIDGMLARNRIATQRLLKRVLMQLTTYGCRTHVLSQVAEVPGQMVRPAMS